MDDPWDNAEPVRSLRSAIKDTMWVFHIRSPFFSQILFNSLEQKVRTLFHVPNIFTVLEKKAIMRREYQRRRSLLTQQSNES